MNRSIPELADDVEVITALPPVGRDPVVDIGTEVFFEPKRSSSSSPNRPPPPPPVVGFLLVLVVLLLLLAADAVGTTTCPIPFVAATVTGITGNGAAAAAGGAKVGTAADADADTAGNPFPSPNPAVDEDTTAVGTGTIAAGAVAAGVVAAGTVVVVSVVVVVTAAVVAVDASPELPVTNAFFVGALRVFPCPPPAPLPLLETIEARSSNALLAGSRSSSVV